MRFSRRTGRTSRVGILTIAAGLAAVACACGSGPGTKAGLVYPEPNKGYTAVDDETAADVIAEMTHYEPPRYPKLAEHAGLQGVVWIKSLVGKDGLVRDAKIHKSCGTAALDQAALVAAPKCKFNPAIKHGQPIEIWVTYKVDFRLN